MIKKTPQRKVSLTDHRQKELLTTIAKLVLNVIALCIFVKAEVYAQAPGQFTFQGVARDANGKVVANKTINLDVYVKPSDELDPFSYNEIHNVNTDPSGAFTIIIGSLGDTGGQHTLLDAKWGIKSYYLQIFLDVNGNGLSYVDLGKTTLLSVPLALFSNKAEQATEAQNAKQAERLIDDVPIVQSGSQNSPALGNVTPGNKLIWYPKKAAFRAGTINGAQWQDSQIGSSSFSTGIDAQASGAASFAAGEGTIVKSKYGFVLGAYNDNSDNPGINVNLEDRIFQIGNGINNNSRLNALTVLRKGYIGIGVINPKYWLDVNGRARIQHDLVNGTAGIFFDGAQTKEAAFVGMKTDVDVGLFIGGNWRFWVNSSGSANLAGNLTQNSDRRLKRDFSPLDNSLSRLSNLKGQHYFWKDTTKSQDLQTGLIAQEVEAYFPELVSTDEKGFKAVNYIGLIPHLIESVKSLKTQTDLISAMKTEMQELRAELNNIKTAAASTSNQLSK